MHLFRILLKTSSEPMTSNSECNGSTQIHRFSTATTVGSLIYTYNLDGYQYLYRYSELAFNGYDYDNQVHQTSLYAQDDWNITDNFTLSLGIRWDHHRGLTDRGTVFATDPVAPRIGFVWKLRENRLTVLKAHYGVYYEALLAAQFEALTDGVLGYKS